MKKILYIFIILFLPLSILTSCDEATTNEDNSINSESAQTTNINTPEYKFAIYLVKDLSSFDAAKTDLNELPLESEPIITEKNLPAYYWKSNVLKFDSIALSDELMKVTGTSGKPFVLTTNGERVYLGTLWTPMSSAVPPEDTPVLNILSSGPIIDKLNKDGYNISPESNEIYLEISAPFKGKDNRNDARIYNALKDADILIE